MFFLDLLRKSMITIAIIYQCLRVSLPFHNNDNFWWIRKYLVHRLRFGLNRSIFFGFFNSIILKVEKHVSSQLFVFVSLFSHAQQLWKLMFVENVVTCVDPSPMSIRAGIVAERKKNFCITCIKSLLMFTLSRCYVRVFHSFDLFYPFHTFWSIVTKKTNKMSAIFYIEWVWYFAVCVYAGGCLCMLWKPCPFVQYISLRRSVSFPTRFQFE